MTVSAASLGSRFAAVGVTFDRGQGGTARVGIDVVAATFTATTGDATPDDGRLDFGTRVVGSAPVEQTITITNLESVDVPVFGCEDPGLPFELVGTCPATLPANGSVELTVRFTPSSAGDLLSVAALAITGGGARGAVLSARVLAHQLALSVSSLGFPDTVGGELTQRSVTLTNLLTEPITMPVAVSGAGFAIDRATVTIPGGARADVVVQFQPPAAGAFTGTLELGSADTPDHTTIPLSGNGLSPGVDPSPAHHSGGCNAGGAGGWLGLLVGLLLRRRSRQADRPSARTRAEVRCRHDAEIEGGVVGRGGHRDRDRELATRTRGAGAGARLR